MARSVQPQEKDMEIIKDKDSAAAPVDERVAALEKKMRELEALVKGLTEELLDLKSIAMRLSKASEERRAELRMPRQAAAAPAAGPQLTVQKKPAITVGAPRTAPPPPPEPEKMEMIMQPDGTLKPEKRKSSDYIVASASYSKKGKGGSQGSGKKNDVIVAKEEEPDSKQK
jgi:hypothetical protein